MISVSELLSELPRFAGKKTVVKDAQNVSDIIADVLKAHDDFKSDYDCIAGFFDKGSLIDICKGLFNFCKRNIKYSVESDELQTTRSPSAILILGSVSGGDCKHYAGFSGGVLDAITRLTGRKINWSYRFCSYKMFDNTPQHVFIVVHDGAKDIWIDPVLDFFNQREPHPLWKVDKKSLGMLARINGIDDGYGLSDVTVITREDFAAGNNLGLVIPTLSPANSGGSFAPVAVQPSVPSVSSEVKLPAPGLVQPAGPVTHEYAQGVTYVMDGKPFSLPARSLGAYPPDTLEIHYPSQWKGVALPPGLPKPVVCAGRIVLLPQGFHTDGLRANNNFWWIFVTGVIEQLMLSYRKTNWTGDVAQLVMDDVKSNNVVDYTTGYTVGLPPSAEIPEGVRYGVQTDFGFEDIDLPPFNTPGNVPPVIPADLVVKYPATYFGLPLPSYIPKITVSSGKVLLSPPNPDANKLRENNNFWLIFIMGSLTPLINAYSQYPYADSGTQLGERILGGYPNDYLSPPQTKTFFGEVLNKLSDYVKTVTRYTLMFVNAGSRLSFLGLVRINAFGFAYKLFVSLRDISKRDDLKQTWEGLGGKISALEAAIELGCLNNPILGGGKKQWIIDTIRAGNWQYSSDPPNADKSFPDGSEITQDDLNAAKVPPGTTIGVVGADDVVYYLAAAAAIIAALGKFLKGIGGAKTDKIVDDATNGMNVLLTAAGEDPIKLGADIGAPVNVYDPATGLTHVVYPGNPNAANGSGITGFIKENPGTAVLVGAAVVVAIMQLSKKRKRVSNG